MRSTLLGFQVDISSSVKIRMNVTIIGCNQREIIAQDWKKTIYFPLILIIINLLQKDRTP